MAKVDLGNCSKESNNSKEIYYEWRKDGFSLASMFSGFNKHSPRGETGYHDSHSHVCLRGRAFASHEYRQGSPYRPTHREICFVLAIASESQEDLVWQLGSVKGEKEDKFAHFSIPTQEYGPGKALIPEGAAAWMAYEVVSRQDVDGYSLVIARVVNQKDLDNPPLVWKKNALFTLKPV